jgi:hypothetical protein
MGGKTIHDNHGPHFHHVLEPLARYPFCSVGVSAQEAMSKSTRTEVEFNRLRRSVTYVGFRHRDWKIFGT